MKSFMRKIHRDTPTERWISHSTFEETQRMLWHSKLRFFQHYMLVRNHLRVWILGIVDLKKSYLLICYHIVWASESVW